MRELAQQPLSIQAVSVQPMLSLASFYQLGCEFCLKPAVQRSDPSNKPAIAQKRPRSAGPCCGSFLCSRSTGKRIDQPKGAIHGLEIAVGCCNIMPHGADGRDARQLHRPMAHAGRWPGTVPASKSAGGALHIALHAGHLTRRNSTADGQSFQSGR